MKTMLSIISGRRIYRHLFIPALLVALLSCGKPTNNGGELPIEGGGEGTTEGSGSNGAVDLQFTGGSLDDLKTSSNDFTFGTLTISGTLFLGLGESLALTVENLTVTSDGSIRFKKSNCKHGGSPSVSISASGKVEVLGIIEVPGESGHRALTSATCNSPYGEDGGNIIIRARSLVVDTSFSTRGGRGSNSVYSDGSSVGQDGGNGGDIYLESQTPIEFRAFSSFYNGGDGSSGTLSDGKAGSSGTLTFLPNNPG